MGKSLNIGKAKKIVEYYRCKPKEYEISKMDTETVIHRLTKNGGIAYTIIIGPRGGKKVIY